MVNLEKSEWSGKKQRDGGKIVTVDVDTTGRVVPFPIPSEVGLSTGSVHCKWRTESHGDNDDSELFRILYELRVCKLVLTSFQVECLCSLT